MPGAQSTAQREDPVAMSMLKRVADLVRRDRQRRDRLAVVMRQRQPDHFIGGIVIGLRHR